MHTDNYVVNSLELHLFFARIMKEHALFLIAGFTPVNGAFVNQAEFYKNEFEKLLFRAVMLSNGIVRPEVLDSGEVVTEFTAMAEQQTEQFTGIGINKEITSRELALNGGWRKYVDGIRMYRQVRQLNQIALNLLDGLNFYKENILKNVSSCEMFTMNNPLLIEHILREAKLYREYIQILEQNGMLAETSMQETECFWNQIMMEHALFIRGLLDPSEETLIQTADTFSKEYEKLLEKCRGTQEQTFDKESLEETVKFRDFKTAGTKGISECKFRSVILPLLADHVLREANHYIRLLKD